jgi:Mrp family chromosome partitioning ATPase
LLKQRFDYIIIDSSPIGAVSDTFYLAALADTCLIIVWMNKTSKDMIKRTVNDLKISDIKSSSLVINDIGAEGKGYGYGGKYGYGYGYGNVYGKRKKG